MKRFRSLVLFVAVLFPVAFLFSGCPWWDDDEVLTVRLGHALDDNTVALWRLCETAASDNAADATGSYNLQQFGNPDVVPGKIGNARLLNGTTKFFQRQGDLALGTAMNGNWTFEGWVYLDNTFSALADLFVYNGLNFTTTQSDTILAEVGVTSARKLYVHQWHDYTPANNFTEILSAATLQTGQFYHLAVSRTAQGGNLYTYRLYVNGAIDNTVAGVSGLTPTVTGASHYIGLGCYTGNVGLGSGGNVLKGRLDDVRISKIARSDAEILQSYQR